MKRRLKRRVLAGTEVKQHGPGATQLLPPPPPHTKEGSGCCSAQAPGWWSTRSNAIGKGEQMCSALDGAEDKPIYQLEEFLTETFT